MNIEDIIPLINEFPYNRNKCSNNDLISYSDFVKHYLEEYLRLIKRIESFSIADIDNNALIEKVTFINDSINKSIKQYLNGFLSNAYQTLSKSINLIKDQIIKHENFIAYHFNDFDDPVYYRARIFNEEVPQFIEKNELFHIPFNKSSIVGNERFSISGFPCLYLGSSLNICFYELSLFEKSPERVFFSEFTIPSVRSGSEIVELYGTTTSFVNETSVRTIESLKLFDLTIKKNFKFIDCEEHKYDALLYYLMAYPFIFSSSIQALDDKNPFIPEYIIPQMILQWVRMNFADIEGIKYSSAKYNYINEEDYNNHYNIVLPPQKINNNGICSFLEKKLSQSNPESLFKVMEHENKILLSVKNDYFKVLEDYFYKKRRIILEDD